MAEWAAVARIAREALGQLGLNCLLVFSGSKGIHLYAQIDGRKTSEQAAAVAHDFTMSMELQLLDLVVARMDPVLSRGNLLFDWSQIRQWMTTVVP
nr:hypothetical protein [Arthrobacter sp. PAMC 25486]